MWDWVVGIGAALLSAYVLLLVVLLACRPRDVSLREAAVVLPDLLRLLHRLAADPALPRGVRVRLVLLFAYLASPIDIVPDFIPVIGYADDAVVVALALRSVVRRAGPEALDRHWTGSDAGRALVRRLAGLPRPVSAAD